MKKQLIASIFSAVIFFGCAPSIKIVQEFQDDSFAAGQIAAQTKVRLYVTDNVNVMEFKKSYDKEYGTNEQFAETMRKEVADSMQRILGCTVSKADSVQDVSALIGGSLDESSVKKTQEMFGAAAEDFFFVVKSVDISNSTSTTVPTMHMSAGGGMFFGGGGSSESCVVTMHAELWNVKTRKKVLGYTSTGDSKVTMFFYGTALKDAVAKSIKYMIKYLVTGVTT